METQGIRIMTESEMKRKWVDFGRWDENTVVSRSGKAILVEHPGGGRREDIWVPVSLCRLVWHETYDYMLYVPMWFCLQNSIYFD